MAHWAYVAAGLIILTLGAELLIRGATAIARRFGLSELLIGLTLVGFGTSTPELVSSVQAALLGSPGVAVGNVVGSNIANIFLILGLSAVIAPVMVDPKSFRRDSAVVLASTVLVILIAMTTGFSRIAGLFFLAALAGYLAAAYFTERGVSDPEGLRHAAEAEALPEGPRKLAVDFVFVVGGLVMLMVGARFLVTGAISIAADFGVSDAVIGLTVVAIGTSLPELVTSAMAALRGKSALALGNVLGSNIYNLLGILGATAAIRPIEAPPEIIAFDNWVMLAATLALVLFARTKNVVARWEGALLLAAYGSYLGWLVFNA